MPKKIRIDAPSLDGLRGFLSRADVDMGCGPHVTKRENRFYAVAIAEDAEIARMNARVADDVHVEILADLPLPQARLRIRREVQRLSRLMQGTVAAVNGDAYDVSAGFSLYATSGASDDYAYSRHRVDPTNPRCSASASNAATSSSPSSPRRKRCFRKSVRARRLRGGRERAAVVLTDLQGVT